MVVILIRMRAAIQGKNTSGKRALGALALAVFALLLAVGTLMSGFAHYRHSGAGADVLATLSLGWLLGWVTGPVLTGDDGTLRMDYFKPLPIPARRLAHAMLGAAFANVSLVFSLVAFGALVAYGAQSGLVPALVGVVVVLLDLVLAVVASTVAVGVLGPTISSRRGRDFGAVLIALVITFLSLTSALVPLIAKKLTSGRSPVLSTVVRVLPSGWGAVAVEAARRSDWAMVVLALAGLVVLIGLLVAIWPAVLRRRLMMSSRGGRRSRTPEVRHRRRRRLPATPFGAVIGKELRLYSRSMLRGLSLMISLLIGVLACVIPAVGGSTVMLPFAGPLFTTIAAGCFCNMYGDDGTSFWLTVITPAVERVDVRGRQWAWVLVVGPLGLLLTLALTTISGQSWAWPWVLGEEPALIGAGVGVLLLVSVLLPFPLSADGGPTPQRQLKVNLMLVGVLLTTLPVPALLIGGTIAHSAAVEWTAVPVGVVWGGLLWWWLGRVTYRRLGSGAPEVFSRLRALA